jgi:Divergent InlB B-repeat domain/Beta-propeller repeat
MARANRLVFGFGLVAAVAVIASALISIDPRDPSTGHRPTLRDGTATSLADLPLSFVPNRGQVEAPVDYLVQGADASLSFSETGIGVAVGSEAVRMRFVSADPAARPRGAGRAEGVVSYFTGRPSQWVTGLPTFRRIVYPDLWPGIDLVASGPRGRLKYSFVLDPGADPRDVRLRWRGATDVDLNDAGQMEVETSIDTLIDDEPVSYQRNDGRRVAVSSSYDLRGTTFGFRVGDYDRTEPLVVDPEILLYAGYVGGDSTEFGHAVAVDDEGASYVGGETTSTEATFPDGDGFGAVPGFDQTANGLTDAFVAKVNPAGTALEYATFLGGSNSGDTVQGIAVDGAGAAYVTGYTQWTTFPTTAGSFDETHNGVGDAFIAKLSPAGTALQYSGYLGGTGEDLGAGIAIDATGAAYITGRTTSTESFFPDGDDEDGDFEGFDGIPGADQVQNGGTDAFVAKLNAAGTALQYAGFLGGSGEDEGRGIAVDGTEAYVTGYAGSTQATFPDGVDDGGDGSAFDTVPGPDQVYNGGTTDAFVAKISAAGTGFAYAGYVGGGATNPDDGRGIAVDGGEAYITGFTHSGQGTFPDGVDTGSNGEAFDGIPGPDQTYNGSSTIPDAFVAKVNSAGSGLSFAGYIGGASFDRGFGIAVTEDGEASLTGMTHSDQTTFPDGDGFGTIPGHDQMFSGTASNPDAFLARVNASGSALASAGYLGGDSTEEGKAIALDGTGAAYIVGVTASGEATFPDGDGFGGVSSPDDTLNNGPGFLDAFVAKVGEAPVLSVDTAGSGGGTVQGPGISCGADCSEEYAHGESVQLSASPAPGSYFAGWSGDCTGTGTCSLTMIGPASVTATFEQVGTKSIALTARPKKVRKGKKTTLTAVVSPCAGHEGDTVTFARGATAIGTVTSDSTCTAVVKAKVRRTSTFTAFAAMQDQDHGAATSTPVKVRVKKPRR